MIALSLAVRSFSPLPPYTNPHSPVPSPDFLADKDLPPSSTVVLLVPTAQQEDLALDDLAVVSPAQQDEDLSTPVVFAPSPPIQDDNIVPPVPLVSPASAEMLHVPSPFATLHERIRTLSSGFLQQLQNGRGNSFECHWRVSLAFARIKQDSRKLAESLSSSAGPTIKAHVTVLQKTVDDLQKRIEDVKRATYRFLVITTPPEANILEISYWSERCPYIDLDFPPPLAMFTQCAVFRVFAIDHDESFLFKEHSYPSVLAAFLANIPLKRSEDDLDELMYKILKAKFNGNSENKKYLLTTLNTCLVIKMPSAYADLWGPDTTNRLGRLLMRVRKKCGGTGKSPRPADADVV